MERGRKPRQKGKFNKKKPHFKPKFSKTDKEDTEIQELEEKRKEVKNLSADELEKFTQLPLSQKTLQGLKKNGFTVPTKVQRQSLVYSLSGSDVVAAAKTGSGKTLAFVIPLLESLYIKKWTDMDGLGALIITPTRELAYQIFEVIRKVGGRHDFSAGLVIGGKDLLFEWNRVRQCNIIVATPGRLLQHLHENPDFEASNVQMLVLDEADQCLSMGFADTMNCILEELPSERQTMLFSATQTRNVQDLIRAGCNKPVLCSAHEHSKTLTPKGLKESCTVCETHDKLAFLWSFITHHKHKKTLIFVATSKQAKYFNDLFNKLNPGIQVLCLYGTMNQLRRMAVYDSFCRKKSAVLFATDLAARGLDFPAVDWVVQVDCPEDVTTYIHRAGRTARYANSGEALLVLTPSEEEPMLENLKAKNITLEKIEVDPSKMSKIIFKMDLVLSKYNDMKEEAVRAFKAHMKHLLLMKDKKVFNVMSVDTDAFARSLGLAVTPRLRFLQKHMNQKKINKDQSGRKTKLTTLDFGGDESDDGDDFLTKSKHTVNFDDDDDDQEEVGDFASTSEGGVSEKTQKVVTKAAVVKKLLKKNITLNTKVVFDEEGEELFDKHKQQSSEAAKEELGTSHGIDIEKMKEIMKAEDRIDKKIFNERQKEILRAQKEKEKAKNKDEYEEEDEEESEMEEETQAFIDNLPDPDEHYKNEDSDDDEDNNKMDEEDVKETSNKTSERKRSLESSEDEGSSSEVGESSDETSSDDSESEGKPKIRGKKLAHQRAKEAKRAKIIESNTLSAIPMDEKEQLALFLLRK